MSTNKVLKIVFDDTVTQDQVDQANEVIATTLDKLNLVYAIFGFEEEDEEEEENETPQ